MWGEKRFLEHLRAFPFVLNEFLEFPVCFTITVMGTNDLEGITAVPAANTRAFFLISTWVLLRRGVVM